jgi:hypothetical protein
MAQRFSIGPLGGAVHGPLDGLARPVATLAIVIAMVAIGPLTSTGASSLVPVLSTVTESRSLQPSARALADDDTCLEGLIEALD